MSHSDGKKLTSARIKAACGHEYRAGILYESERDLSEQRATLSKMNCLDCIEKKQAAVDKKGERRI